MAEANITIDVERRGAWRSRKLWFCLLTEATATVLLYLGLIKEPSWLVVTTTCLWAYIAGNVGTTASDALAKILAALVTPRVP